MATGRRGRDAGASATQPSAHGAQNDLGAIRNLDEWKTGDEPLTAAQRSHLHTLAAEARERVDDEGMTKADAARKIGELQRKTGRGQPRRWSTGGCGSTNT
ncbi:MAG: DUF3072 domain-containing protein [Steroidobacteraceae bacterium]|nr:DUF3072 domain-containing protein [Steroidobacteraceae bacterium]